MQSTQFRSSGNPRARKRVSAKSVGEPDPTTGWPTWTGQDSPGRSGRSAKRNGLASCSSPAPAPRPAHDSRQPSQEWPSGVATRGQNPCSFILSPRKCGEGEARSTRCAHWLAVARLRRTVTQSRPAPLPLSHTSLFREPKPRSRPRHRTTTPRTARPAASPATPTPCRHAACTRTRRC